MRKYIIILALLALLGCTKEIEQEKTVLVFSDCGCCTCGVMVGSLIQYTALPRLQDSTQRIFIYNGFGTSVSQDYGFPNKDTIQ